MFRSGSSRRVTFPAAMILAVVLALSATIVAFAASLIQISSDPFTNTTSQHLTEVEPDTFASGSTIVSAFQQGRFTDGGSSDIGFATSIDNGATWTHGSLPGDTVFTGGTFARISDPAVAFDPKHNVWLISGLALNSAVVGTAVTVNRSTDGGLAWTNPVIVASATGSMDFDKEWIVCDGTSTSAHFGNCYIEWDDFGHGNRIKMSTSTDGGLTWGAAKSTTNNATGIGGQPLVQSNGTVIVPLASASENAMLAFRSTNGGASWTAPVTVSSPVSSHVAGGGLRSGSLPSATIDGAGKVYVVWEDCRFESGCTANDLVMSTSSNGTTWSAVKRIPIDAVGSGTDHFIPGIDANKATSGANAHLALAFYYYPVANCTTATCQLDVGYVSSTNGGSTWSAKLQIGGPMTLSQIAPTTQGPMVGDYMSTSIVSGRAYPVFAVGNAPSGGFAFNEGMFTVVGGLAVAAGDNVASDAGASEAVASESAAVAASAR